MRRLMAVAALLTASAAMAQTPQQQFFDRLQSLCGKAFEGRVAASEPAGADKDFQSSRLVMHVRDCTPGEIRIPFHVGEDRSRTWVISRLNTGLRLKHDHRHRDGSEDALSQYGGETTSPGTAERQEFPADAFSRALFQRSGAEVSIPNIWAVEVSADSFTYELARPGRLVRVTFDTSRPVAAPPAPWGSERQTAR